MHGKERWIMSDSGNEQKKSKQNYGQLTLCKLNKSRQVPVYWKDLDPFVDFVLESGEIGKLTERIQEIKKKEK